MRQLDLFTTTCSIEEIAKTGKQTLEPTSPLAKEGLGEISTPTMPSERLTHYRTKLAMWDRIGYHKVAQEIAED